MPKGHAVHHMLAFVFLWGAIDNARLNNFEHDHTLFVKTAVKRTRMHLKSMLRELEGATDRIMAVRYVRGLAAGWLACNILMRMGECGSYSPTARNLFLRLS